MINDDNSESMTQNDVQKETLSQEQMQDLKDIIDKGTGRVGHYELIEKILAGKAVPLNTRMTKKSVQDIISNNDSFEKILKAFRDQQPYADFVGGSGVSILEYWFDSEGNEKIVIIVEQSQIYYVHSSEGIVIANELIYEGRG